MGERVSWPERASRGEDERGSRIQAPDDPSGVCILDPSSSSKRRPKAGVGPAAAWSPSDLRFFASSTQPSARAARLWTKRPITCP